MGRPKDYNTREKVRKYLKLGLNNAEISRVILMDEAQVSRTVRELKKEDKTLDKKCECAIL